MKLFKYKIFSGSIGSGKDYFFKKYFIRWYYTKRHKKFLYYLYYSHEFRRIYFAMIEGIPLNA